MNFYFIIALAVAIVSADDQCAWGESYWCVSLKNAKECGAFDHCLNTLWKNQKIEKDNSDICTFCENVINDVRSYVTDKHTWDQIKQFMDSACAVIPIGDAANKCKQMVDQYLPELLAMLEKDIDPQMICSLIGLCKGLKDTVQHHPINSLHRVPLFKVPIEKSDPLCADCKKLMEDLKKEITSTANEKQIEQLLEEKLCKKLQYFADECNQLIEKYLPQIMDILSSQIDPDMICQILGFCEQTTSTPKALLAKMRLVKSPLFQAGQVVGNMAGCEICKTAVAELQKMGKDKMTQEEVEAYIKKEICARLGTLKDACDTTVDVYGPELFQLLSEELDPSVVCQSLGLCASGRLFNSIQPVVVQEKLQMANTVQSEIVKDSPGCTICELVVKKVDEMLSQNATEEEIEAALDKVCALLPAKISKECTDFVNTYGPAIITLLSEELDPHMVCVSLGLCKENQKGKNQVNDSESCEVCKMMMEYLDSLLSQNSTVENIEHTVEKLCSYLPKSYKKKCNELVNEYGKTIIEMLIQFADPKTICKAIGLCDGCEIKEAPMEKIIPIKKTTMPLLGTNECTYGPAYWCASRENAEKCKAVEHCKKHVWKN